VASQSWWREVALLSLRQLRPFCEAFFRAMLDTGIAENDPDLAERCLAEALYFAPDPFVEVLNSKRPKAGSMRRAHDARVTSILRLLKERADQVPELAAISRRLAESGHNETRGFAQEILARSGIGSQAPAKDAAVVIDPQSGITWVRIPAGTFLMGSDTGEDDERPVHPVQITHDFLLGKYPVTNAQYRRFMEASKGKVKNREYWDDRRFNQPEQPVVGVSWTEAVAFCEWAGARLPTEAEWECACRAGTTTDYSFGADAELLDEYAWYEKNSGGQTQPVGAKQPNPWGLYDMHGNVWEWCADWGDSQYYTKSPEVDPQGPKTGADRVFRGGGWCDDARRVRAAFRFWVDPDDCGGSIGFRCVSSGES